MPAFSKTSAARLATCHPDLQRLFNDVVQIYDCAIFVGERGKEAQDIACHDGLSKTPYPTSKHNCKPSKAADAGPSPVDWKNIDGPRGFREFANFVLLRAKTLGIPIRWGGEWGDYDHFELMEG